MGRHQRLGPQGELIHTPELTNYEKVRKAALAIKVLYYKLAEQSNLEHNMLMKTPVPVYQRSHHHDQSRRYQDIHSVVLSQTLHSEALQNSQQYNDGNRG